MTRGQGPCRGGAFNLEQKATKETKFRNLTAAGGLHVLFFLSGASALAFQIAWARMLSTGLGHEMPAVLAVVGAIFGGMAAGAWGSERVLLRSRRAGRWFGILELLVGLWGLVSIALIPVVNQAALAVIGLETGPLGQWMAGFTFTGVALLPATMAMGASFPAMERFLAPLSTQGRCVGGLYAASTFGAVAGVIGSAGFALPTLGFTQTVAFFSGTSLACGAAALAMEAFLPSGSGANWTAGAGPVGAALGRRAASLLWTAGLLGIGFEVIGVRLLAQVLENTVYTYAAVLAVFLLGTAAGGALYQLWDWRWDVHRLFAWLAAAVAIDAWLLAWTPAIYDWLRTRLDGTGDAVLSAEVLTAAVVFAGPAILMGTTFSHLVQSARKRGAGAGPALAWNTLGAALAPLVFGVVLLPSVGAKWSLVLLVGGYVALGWTRTGWQRGFAAVSLAVAVMLPARLPSFAQLPGEKILARREGISDTVAVVERADGHRNLVVNHRFMMGGTGAATAERRQGTIPLLLHRQPRRALFLGLGSGITFAAAGPHEGLSADGVELVPEIVEMAHWFRPDNALPAGPDRFRVYVADARRFIRTSTRTYDVIVADLFHPARDGAGPLYALEHFRAMRTRLAPGGLVCQWLPLYQLDTATLRVIVRTFMEVFPDAHAFLLRFNVDTPVVGLMGGLEPELYGPDYLARRVSDPGLAERMQVEQLRDPFHFFGCFVAGPEGLRRFSLGAPLNTDDRPVVLFRAPRAAQSRQLTPYGRLLLLIDQYSSNPGDLFPTESAADTLFERDLADFIAARNAYLHGLAAETEGDLPRALEAYVESARLSRHFSTGYARALSIAMREHKANPELSRRLLEGLAAVRPDRPVAAEVLHRLFP